MLKETENYKTKLELFNKRISQFKSIIVSPEPNLGVHKRISMDIDSIIKLLDVDEDNQYFSINYFYEGLQNSGDITASYDDSLYFIVYVIASMLQEMYLRATKTKCYEYLSEIMINGFKFKTRNEDKAIILEEIDKNFILYKLPYLINHQQIKFLSNEISNPKEKFNEMKRNLDKQEKTIDEKIQKYQRKSDEIVEFIKTQNTKLNFVGLGKAFQQINDEKKISKNWILFFLVVLFLFLIGIPVKVYCEIYCIEQPNIYKAIPFTVIEFLLLYVFRLFYQQYMFVKSELLQVSLRHSLCAFIEEYMEFKKENKDNTVNLFEQLIFSNIISDEKKVPATIDGLDSITNMIQALKGK